MTGAAHQTGQIDESDAGRDGLPYSYPSLQMGQTLIRQRNDGVIGFDGAEGIIGGLGVLRAGQRIKDGAFADVGQADNADA